MGASVPTDLKKLNYSWVICELPEGGGAAGIHAMVPNLFLKNKGFFNGIWDFRRICVWIF